ncbi:unnamed protein product [Clonostachys solani]|uniref:ER transporter 6TM N-terminal domain-containing protein n=1 Tax=Clonostachys solani TaxID=160281 RepID=A0A9N9Z4E3_9HYPO|nr:unnamed protein product [Clonostachys solani]
MAVASLIRKFVKFVWGDWQTNELWQRILKTSLACVIALSFAVIPELGTVYGLNTYLIPMVTVFAHPGQRMGKVIETLVMALLGSLLGLGWSLLGLFLSTLAIGQNPSAASAIRAIFMLVSVLTHGYVRSQTPRLFALVWFELISSATILLGSTTQVTVQAFTGVYYPILTGSAIVLFVNLCIFPEHATSYLGTSTINTLSESMDTLERASHWFVTPGGDSDEAKEEAAKSACQDAKKKTALGEFLDDFPNPFKSSSSKKTPPPDIQLTTMASLSAKSSKLRAQVTQCKSAQNEVNFEFAVSPLAPKSLKLISKREISSLVQNTITLIGACENKFVLLSNTENAVTEECSDSDTESDFSESLDEEALDPIATKELHGILEDDDEDRDEQIGSVRLDDDDFEQIIEDVKPLREIESASSELLESILRRIREPVEDFDKGIKGATDLLIACLAYCYDVSKLPSGAPTPQGIRLEEIDIRIDSFTEALGAFDTRCPQELKLAAIDSSGKNIDLMPRMEMFLVSSFLLGYRQAATHVLEMLRHTRALVEERLKRNNRPRVWIPHHTDIRQWLYTSGEWDPMVLPEAGRKELRESKSSKEEPGDDSSDITVEEGFLPRQRADEENTVGKSQEKETSSKPELKSKDSTKDHKTLVGKVRANAADALEWAQRSEDVKYAIKLALAVFIVSWPSFVASWRGWYAEVRGIWAPLQLVLVFEVSIGTSLFVFFIRLLGVIFGCTIGLLSYEMGRGNRVAMVIILILGVVPSVYIQLGTKYVKAGMVSTTTMCVVALATINQTGTATENFYKRLVAFLVGSVVAITVEIFILPVRARHRLVESLSSAVRQVQAMHAAVWVGIDSPQVPNFRSHQLDYRFSHAREKAQTALAAAEMFLPFCRNEPRLKGSFKPLEPIYKEIIYVLHQIINRMDNVVDLRKAYGSSVLEDLHMEVYAYRRNVAASNTLILFSVQEALTDWLPLPQFLPSSRLAQARLVNHVRETLASADLSSVPTPHHQVSPSFSNSGGDDIAVVDQADLDEYTASIITERKFLSWNANAAGHMEIIEYLEELVDLTKLLVGVNAFRSGLLEKPKYKDYVQQTRAAEAELSRLASRRSRRTSKATADGRGGSTTLARAAAVAASVQKFRRRTQELKMRKQASAASNPQEVSGTQAATGAGRREAVDTEDDAIPMSLRRVRTRIERESVVVRRRGFSTGAM